MIATLRGRVRIATLSASLLAMPVAPSGAQAKPFEDFSKSALSLRDSIVSIARAQVGRKYRFGGTTPERGFDCSGLVKYVLAALKVEMPRTSREQSRVGEAIARDTTQLRPGDLLLFGKAKSGVSHVGIYIGEGRYIHASSVAGRVIESPINRAPSPLIKVFQSARRILLGDTAVVATIATARHQ